MASSHTPTSAPNPALKISSSFQPTTSSSSPATPSHHQPQSQSHPQSQQQQQQQQQQQHEDIPQTAPFPPPQTFDILPPLHDLLLRLASTPPANPHQHVADPTSAAGNGASSAAAAGPVPGPGGSQAITTATRSTAIDTAAVAFLDPKLLLSEASAVKIRVQKAKAAVEALPDMERGVAEQEEEIADLEERIERLRGVIREFGRRSKGVCG
ncbi:hypothetical protein ACJ72_07338 [Emergomyces africanus]|uniref:Mediator of RNA polymerase II transcription subunit 9 n=1 Tax=Emergomyces africanus TaxID=1955775 RepID=A0A1B7NNV8_9EURO|nr:hypothetical protein ACJ72_07338 [Emergomyces africanus]